MKDIPKEHRIFLPAKNSIVNNDNDVPLLETLYNYIDREFPGIIDPNEHEGNVYSVPKRFLESGAEQQAGAAEEIMFQRLKQLQIGKQWCVFFHGISYGGVSHRNERSGKYIMREHDFVVFCSYQGSRYLALIEVKSTCDSVLEIDNQFPFPFKISDSKGIKNNKRGAQHQLRDHIEMMFPDFLNENTKSVQTYIAWPFLSGITTSPNRQTIYRWKEDGCLHIFRETLADQKKFEYWWQNVVLQDSWKISETKWMNLLQKFIVLSCGVFVEELHEGMMTLLSQTQLQVLSSPTFINKKLVIHGAAGTGKTMLILYKLWQLFKAGELHDNSRALYICYWPAIRSAVCSQLEKMNIGQFVDSTRFYITTEEFLKDKYHKKYRHIFWDEAEAICLAFNEKIVQKTFASIEAIRQGTDGCLWYLVDVNQAAMFRIKHDNVLHKPDVILNQVMRSTKNVFQMFQGLLKSPGINYLGHDIEGPPIYWVEVQPETRSIDLLVEVVIDLCLTKGVKPNDLCAVPFYVTDEYREEPVNKRIQEKFAPEAFMPQALVDVEKFLVNPHPSHFLLPWSLRIKGLDFKVIVIVVDSTEDLDTNDPEDRSKLYIMASRCSCLLILISTHTIKASIDVSHSMMLYPFQTKRV